MSNVDKSITNLILLISFFFVIFSSPVFADENYGNVLPDANMINILELESGIMSLPFEPNDYNFLVYNPGSGSSSIEEAMRDILGRSLTPSEIRGPGNVVTANDLATHDILICGWNEDGYTTGLHSDILATGITGRIVLSGHDLDYHIVSGPTPEIQKAAKTMLIQSINYVLEGGGTGLVTLGEYLTQDSPFSYLPSSWHISSIQGNSDNVSTFTTQGIESGIFDGLEPYDMCNWSASFHDNFTILQDSNFVTFEKGIYNNGDVNVTVARPLGIFGLTKIDDVNDGNCILPEHYINYTISYHDVNRGDTNVVITDFLSDEIDYNRSTPTGVYDANSRTVRWTVGRVSVGDSNTYSLRVRVNNLAEPMGYALNRCRMQGDHIRNDARCLTPVCSWNPGIIYVDQNATSGRNTGMSWKDAYLDLQKGLNKAAIGCGSQIWVADGNYTPSIWDPCNPVYPTFVVYKGVPVYGHFAGNETALSQRHLNDPNKQSILSGTDVSSDYVVTISNRDTGNYLDGFTITGAFQAGVRINDANLYIANCLITGNGNGIKAENSNFTVFDCNVYANSNNGISAINSYFTVAGNFLQNNGTYGLYGYFQNISNIKTTVNNNIIRNNQSTQGGGIYFQGIRSPIDILNNLIFSNYYGIDVRVSSNNYNPIIQNNTVVKNTSAGIYLSSSDYPSIIRNCIIWGNSPEIDSYGNLASVSYCCIKDGFNGTGNISDNPCFVGYDINDFHLQYASPCIDAGDPNVNYDGQTDIDGQPRVMLGKSAQIVDRGADEYLKADFNGDGIVNFIDFATLASKWRMIDPDKSLDNDNDVDINDLKIFCQYWLLISPFSSFYQSFFEQSEMDLIEQEGFAEEPADYSSGIVEKPIDDEQQSLLLDENQPPGIWLTCDGNMNPAYGDEVTIYVHSEPFLLAMDVMMEVDGDANVTTAMSTADCNDYGWDTGWNTDPYIDPDGHWVSICGVSWNRNPTGNVGYFKFHYYGGVVTVYITDYYDAYDSNLEPVAFSLDPLVFGYDPNQ